MKPIIDISQWQPPASIDYARLSQEVSGVIIRCGYGSQKTDAAYERHYQEFTNQGIPVGVYHFLTQYQNAETQARLFQSLTQGKTFQLGYWADVENESGATPLTRQQVQTYINNLEALLGTAVGIYTSKSQWSAIMGGAYFTTRKLWVAHYGVQAPNLPTGWSNHWMHQYTSSGSLPGYAYRLDLNRFNGSEELFAAWVNGEEIPEPEIEPPLTRLYYPCDPNESYITQFFGENPGTYPASRGHNGLDFGFNYQVGKPIYAAEDGKVEVARADTTGYGRHVRIRHRHGLTIYGHLSKINVSVGEQVTARQLIGLSGGHPSDPYAGFSTGPHLHFEYRWDVPAPQVPGGYTYNAVDPLPLLITSQEEGPMIHRIQIITDGLRIRTGPGTGYAIAGMTQRNEIYEVYEVRGDWSRIGAARWVNSLPAWVKIIQDPGTSIEERLADLTSRIEALEALVNQDA